MVHLCTEVKYSSTISYRHSNLIFITLQFWETLACYWPHITDFFASHWDCSLECELKWSSQAPSPSPFPAVFCRLKKGTLANFTTTDIGKCESPPLPQGKQSPSTDEICPKIYYVYYQTSLQYRTRNSLLICSLPLLLKAKKLGSLSCLLWDI